MFLTARRHYWSSVYTFSSGPVSQVPESFSGTGISLYPVITILPHLLST